MNKMLTYFGNYKIDYFYEMNQILMNKEAIFFRVLIDMKSKSYEKIDETNQTQIKDFLKKKNIMFVVITEINLVIFEPKPDQKSVARIVLCVDIREVLVLKIKSLFDDILKYGLSYKCFEYLEYFTMEIHLPNLILFYQEIKQLTKMLQIWLPF